MSKDTTVLSAAVRACAQAEQIQALPLRWWGMWAIRLADEYPWWHQHETAASPFATEQWFSRWQMGQVVGELLMIAQGLQRRLQVRVRLQFDGQCDGMNRSLASLEPHGLVSRLGVSGLRRNRLTELAAEPSPARPPQFADFLVNEVNTWVRPVREARLQIEP